MSGWRPRENRMGGRSPHCASARRACQIQRHLSAGRKLASEMVASNASNVRRQAHHRTNHHPLVASAGKIRIHQPGSASFVLLRYQHVPEPLRSGTGALLFGSLVVF
jgi:hypothetical protein